MAEEMDLFNTSSPGNRSESEGSPSRGRDTDTIGDLSKTKLTNNDYIKRAQSAKSKKGKYGVTVPKPFGFDVRDAKKTKSIRETKVEEMVKQKELDEETHLRTVFRSKKVPPEVMINKYNNLIEAENQRRATVRAESLKITQSRERPFAFWEREKHNIAAKKARIEDYENNPPRHPHFRANPIPRSCSVLIMKEKEERDKLERDERINQMAKMSIKNSKMPESMKKYEEKKKKEALTNAKLQ